MLNLRSLRAVEFLNLHIVATSRRQIRTTRVVHRIVTVAVARHIAIAVALRAVARRIALRRQVRAVVAVDIVHLLRVVVTRVADSV